MEVTIVLLRDWACCANANWIDDANSAMVWTSRANLGRGSLAPDGLDGSCTDLPSMSSNQELYWKRAAIAHSGNCQLFVGNP
jgi:hypothetical protein